MSTSLIYGWAGTALALVFALLWGWGEHNEAAKYKAELATVQTEAKAAKTQFLADSAQMQQQYKDLQAKYAADYAAQTAANAAALAKLRADNSVLNHAIDCYASGNCQGVSKTATTGGCDNSRSEVLGRLLEQGTELVIECIGNSKSAATQIRALIKSTTIGVSP